MSTKNFKNNCHKAAGKLNPHHATHPKTPKSTPSHHQTRPRFLGLSQFPPEFLLRSSQFIFLNPFLSISVHNIHVCVSYFCVYNCIFARIAGVESAPGNMSTARGPGSDDADSAAGGIDTSPLLGEQIFRNRPYLHRPPSLRGAARFLRRASSRRMMREPSMRVREAAAEQIEERQSDWAYSKPIVVLDLVWNVAFVVVSISVLIISRSENPSMPLRLWVVGYALQCLLHMICVCVEYKKRSLQRHLAGDSPWRNSGSNGGRWNSSSSSSDDGEMPDYSSDRRQNEDETSVAKHLESANTMFSFIWWIIGFYWVSAGGQNLINDSPQLYWLCITFLAFDVFFVVICVAVACIIGIAVCCCLPCIIAILYAVADQQEGATKEDIERLPKYKFRRFGDSEKQNGEIQESFGGIMTECDTDAPIEHVLPLEDSECCICLCSYDDGTELRELPCRHHFHSTCIDKWLYINATCPLCKLNILKTSNQSGSEEA